ncbi:MAG: ribonuclease H-like domain-containing protein [Christensenellaceae bacterium]|nr:ribonuclease H-like domain-containing protein [Christensenellaceae bacterium]
MNLRDKLNALSSKPAAPKPAPPVKTFSDCWHECLRRPLTEFPGCFNLRRETIMLMQGDDMPDPLDPRRILYLDTETTGLKGGAGTVAFLVGLGWLTDTGFELHQYVMRDYPEEKYLLQAVEETARRFDVICSFNGRSFDVPLLRDRFLMNRMRTDCLDKPHIDLLHIARRVWKLRLRQCNLGRLEEAILGMPRVDDLPGSEVPERYFRYLKCGDFSLLTDVLEHNAQDIASLCTLLGHMARLYEAPEILRHSEDVYSMGVALERMRHPEEARRCYRLASAGSMRVPGQLRLAGNLRRAGERSEAKTVWQGMMARHEGGIVPLIELAKHYEHIERDPAAALDMTRRAMMMMAEPSLTEDSETTQTREALEKRYQRLKGKLERSC